MRAWELVDQGKALRIYYIDDGRKQVIGYTSVRMKQPMTYIEAQKYFDDHYADKEPTTAA